jgi:3-phenylpropionate/trans-cinnamate dioxygenase ferredoxin reductase subunit
MPHYPYLIIGGGMTADAATIGIRRVDTKNSIGIISTENYAPYDRPPLTKGLWKGRPLEKIWRKTKERGVDLFLGVTIDHLDTEQKQVTDHQGNRISYDKLLLATGGSPQRLSPDDEDIIYYRTLDDYQLLRQLVKQQQHIAVIGAGFIGSEIAAALTMVDQQVTLIFRSHGICSHLFPPDLSQYVNKYYQEKGVELRPDTTVVRVERRGNRKVLITKGGNEIQADVVVAGIGIQPNTSLAESGGLKVENGIIVDQFLRTSMPDIYAAGDVANFYNPTLDQRVRIEHEDNANQMGQTAGENMARQLSGQEPISYQHLPFFYADLFDLGYEAIGDLDPSLEVYADWQEKYHKGVLYYIQSARVRGVLLWNVWEQVDAARQLIANPGPFNASTIKGRLPA